MTPMRLLGALALLVGCGDRPAFEAGEGCLLNSDCAAPLVCRLERCRTQCAGVRDCPIDSLCVRDADGLGACRLDDERDCALDSECPALLVCRSGACTNECLLDDDCQAGSFCAEDPGGALGCLDPAMTECSRPSDCPAELTCAADGRCRQECREDRDCRDGELCLREADGAVCGAPTAGP